LQRLPLLKLEGNNKVSFEADSGSLSVRAVGNKTTDYEL
jgi:hypothetical protein